jgi:cytochrome P450/NADPH-cytochrome P450 reductase
VPVPAQTILGEYVELGDVVTPRQLGTLTRIGGLVEQERQLIVNLSAEPYDEKVLGPKTSLLDILEQFPALDIVFGQFLDLLPSMRPRQ